MSGQNLGSNPILMYVEGLYDEEFLKRFILPRFGVDFIQYASRFHELKELQRSRREMQRKKDVLGLTTEEVANLGVIENRIERILPVFLPLISTSNSCILIRDADKKMENKDLFDEFLRDTQKMIQKEIPNVPSDRIFVCISEIESWYISGLWDDLEFGELARINPENFKKEDIGRIAGKNGYVMADASNEALCAKELVRRIIAEPGSFNRTQARQRSISLEKFCMAIEKARQEPL